jgi:hypothetical protein
MKRLLLLSVLAALLAGCSTHAYTDEDRIEEANEYCGFRGYKYLKIYHSYGEIDAIYCSLGDNVISAPYTNPLANPDVPHE